MLKVVLAVVYALGVAAGCVWVPFHARYPGGLSRPLGYGWLWAGPPPGHYTYLAQVDITRLSLTLLAWTALAGAAACVLSLKRR